MRKRTSTAGLCAFSGSAGEPDETVLQHQVMIGGGHVDAPHSDRLAVRGMDRRQMSRPAQDDRHGAAAVGGDVQDDEHGGGQIGGEPSDQLGERLNAPRGRTDQDDVTAGHWSPWSRISRTVCSSTPGGNGFWRNDRPG